MLRNVFILLFFAITSTLLNAQQEGFASYYHPKFEGRKTANGELYNSYFLTAAHRTLPFGTIVRVTRLDNQNSVICTINDRGPFSNRFVIDLSKGAADAIEITSSTKVRIERVKEVINPDNTVSYVSIENTNDIPTPALNKNEQEHTVSSNR